MSSILIYVYIAVAGIGFFLSHGAVHYTEFAKEQDRSALETLVTILYLIAAVSLGILIFNYWLPN